MEEAGVLIEMIGDVRTLDNVANLTDDLQVIVVATLPLIPSPLLNLSTATAGNQCLSKPWRFLVLEVGLLR